MKNLLGDWKLLLYTPLAVVMIFVSYYYARNGIVHVEAQQAVHINPYVADYWLTSYVMNPKGEIQEKRHVGRSSDGATSTVTTVLDGPEVAPHRTVVLPDGRRILINDSQGIRSTFYMKDQELARLKNEWAKTASVQTDCSGGGLETLVGKDTVLGYQTQVWKLEQRSDDGGTVYRMTHQRTPELGCLDLDTTLGEIQPDGKVKMHWTLTAQSLSQTEPPEADLYDGQSYKEVLPSEFAKRTYKTAALADEAAKSIECTTHRCGVVEDFKAQWNKQDGDYRARMNAIGGKQ